MPGSMMCTCFQEVVLAAVSQCGHALQHATEVPGHEGRGSLNGIKQPH